MNGTDSTRDELLAAFPELCRLRPEWRIGQTLANVSMTAGRLDAGGIWDLEDVEALAAIRILIDESGDVLADVA